MPKWTAHDIPDQAGRVIIITGANSGVGYESARALARKNATVIMACRNPQKAKAAHDQIIAEIPNARLDVMTLDLSDLNSVRDFAEAFHQKYDRLDVLMNNAGVMAIPRAETAQGFEMQFGVNHLAHFALTGRLLDILLKTRKSRVVTLTSQAHINAKIDFDDLNHQQKYGRWEAYGQSKLANALFAIELARRLKAANVETISIAAQPGLANTNLQKNMAERTGSGLDRFFANFIMDIAAQSQEMGALPQLYAATMPDVHNGDYFGPAIGGFRGWPEKRKLAKHAYDAETARRLWEVSEQLTEVHYDALQTASV
ncbi:MAG: short-chain dehydrogenase [Phototrophicales bacterium]|nr:MAG: short-chain dehydrogenase [Phototrophicales bacterium]